MDRIWIGKKTKRECDYRLLTKWEIIVIDPHKVKGKGGSKRDLSVCIGSNCDDRGEVVEHPKKTHYDDKGGLVRPSDVQYQPIGINVNDPEFEEEIEKAKQEQEKGQTRVEISLYVTGFDKDPATTIKELGLKSVERTWKKGEPRAKGTLLKHAQNGFSIGVDQKQKTFEDRVLSVIKPLHARKDKLRKTCGDGVEVELSICAYIAGEVPSLSLSREAVQLLADLGGEMDMDLYFLDTATE